MRCYGHPSVQLTIKFDFNRTGFAKVRQKNGGGGGVDATSILVRKLDGIFWNILTRVDVYTYNIHTT